VESSSLPFAVVEIPRDFDRHAHPFVYLLIEVAHETSGTPPDLLEATVGTITRLERVWKGQSNRWMRGVGDSHPRYMQVPVHGMQFVRMIHPAVACKKSPVGAFWVPRSAVHEALCLLEDAKLRLGNHRGESSELDSSLASDSELAWEEACAVTLVASTMYNTYALIHNARPPDTSACSTTRSYRNLRQHFKRRVGNLGTVRALYGFEAWDDEPMLIDSYTAAEYARLDLDALLVGAVYDPMRAACVSDIHARAVAAVHECCEAGASKGALPTADKALQAALAAVPDNDPVV